jgi:PAP2 superfamily
MSQKGDAVVRAESRAHRPRPPGLVASAVVGALALVVVAVSAWLATRPEAKTAQTDVVRWFNQPPQPFAAIFAAVNPLFRPVPLTVLAIVLAGWVLLAAGDLPQRLEVARALALSLLIAEVLAQVMKRIASQPRPTALIPGLDVHGYPQDPWGNAYPSAHTALVVAAVCALWALDVVAGPDRRHRAGAPRAAEPDLHRGPLAHRPRRRRGDRPVLGYRLLGGRQPVAAFPAGRRRSGVTRRRPCPR